MATTIQQIDTWRGVRSEHQRLEFKEAKTQFDNRKLYKYCVALANEGGGHLLLGIEDQPPRSVWGRFPQRHIRRARAWGTVLEVSIGGSIPDGRTASGASTYSESTGKGSQDFDSAITTAVLWLNEQGPGPPLAALASLPAGGAGDRRHPAAYPLPQAAD